MREGQLGKSEVRHAAAQHETTSGEPRLTGGDLQHHVSPNEHSPIQPGYMASARERNGVPLQLERASDLVMETARLLNSTGNQERIRALLDQIEGIDAFTTVVRLRSYYESLHTGSRLVLLREMRVVGEALERRRQQREAEAVASRWHDFVASQPEEEV